MLLNLNTLEEINIAFLEKTKSPAHRFKLQLKMRTVKRIRTSNYVSERVPENAMRVNVSKRKKIFTISHERCSF